MHPEPAHHKYAFLESGAALDRFLESWEQGTLPRSEWTHAAHVAVAACYTWHREEEEAFARMKSGILRYNTAAGVANTEDSGYHETLTRLWIGLVKRLVDAAAPASRLEAARAAVRSYGDDRRRYERYYTFDVVKDRRARREWVEPDLSPDGT